MATSILSSQALCVSIFWGEINQIIWKQPGFVPVLLHEKVGMLRSGKSLRLIVLIVVVGLTYDLTLGNSYGLHAVLKILEPNTGIKPNLHLGICY